MWRAVKPARRRATLAAERSRSVAPSGERTMRRASSTTATWTGDRALE